MKAKLTLIAIALILLVTILSSCSGYTCPTYASSGAAHHHKSLQ